MLHHFSLYSLKNREGGNQHRFSHRSVKSFVMLFWSPGVSPKHTPTPPRRSLGAGGESMPWGEEAEPAALRSSPRSPSWMPEETQEPTPHDTCPAGRPGVAAHSSEGLDLQPHLVPQQSRAALGYPKLVQRAHTCQERSKNIFHSYSIGWVSFAVMVDLGGWK